MVESGFDISGTALCYRTVVPGTALGPEWAVVRLRRALDALRGSALAVGADGSLTFSIPLLRFVSTVVDVPLRVDGTVALTTQEGATVVTAQTSLPAATGALLCGLGSVIYLYQGDRISLRVYWFLMAFLMVATVLHTYQILSTLRTLSRAAAAIEETSVP